MSKKKQRRVVVDASIARAAGKTDNAHAATTRSFLERVLRNGLHTVFSEALIKEWDKHQSNFARQWRGQMVSRRRFVLVRDNEYATLGTKLADCGFTKVELAAARKDFHLVSAALSTDKFIFSYDDRARDVFARASVTLEELRILFWLHPINDPEPTQAICAGRKLRNEWTLAHK